MHYIMHMDVSAASKNQGDFIITEAVNNIIEEVFPKAFVVNIPTHLPTSSKTLKDYEKFKLRFVGGTNLLHNLMGIPLFQQWKNLGFTAYKQLRPAILLGVGWANYEEKKVPFYTRNLLQKVLSKDFQHSVRDEYTKLKLAEAGITNVINTGCPTMWNLTEDHCSTIKAQKSNEVVFTLTDYRVNEERDKKIIDVLVHNYEKVYFWPQGSGDYEYFLSLSNNPKIEIINSSLKSYDELLNSTEDIDYVGTRLHAGIRALQHKRRAIIVAVDNRAKEISKDTRLVVCDEKEIDSLDTMIASEIRYKLNINFEAINKWKSQFANL